MVKRIMSWINLAMAAVKGAFAIKDIAKGEGDLSDKIIGVSAELAKVTAKLQVIAEETPATWDDDFADALKAILDSIAEGLLEDLIKNEGVKV